MKQSNPTPAADVQKSAASRPVVRKYEGTGSAADLICRLIRAHLSSPPEA